MGFATEDGPVPERLRVVLTAVVTFLGQRPAVCAGLLAAASSHGELRELLAVDDTHIAAPIQDPIALGVSRGDFDVPSAP